MIRDWMLQRSLNSASNDLLHFCPRKNHACGGPVPITASIKDSDVIQKILKHLGLDQDIDPQNRSPPADLTDQQTTLV
jgi:hypothetical protein